MKKSWTGSSGPKPSRSISPAIRAPGKARSSTPMFCPRYERPAGRSSRRAPGRTRRRRSTTRSTGSPPRGSGKLAEAKTLRERLEALARQANGGLLIVLDQFEEFVILAGPERQKAFAAFLADLRARPIKGLKLLLVLRSEYTTAIDELGLPLLRKGENWQEIGRFTIAAGTKFMARSGLALQQDALDRLAISAAELDDSPGMIRPITLNVVGHVLSEGRRHRALARRRPSCAPLHRAVGRTARHSCVRATRPFRVGHRAGHQAAAFRAGPRR